MSAMRRLLPWFAVWALAGAMAAVTTAESLERYREFRSGWAWDLAYNNQWFWALVFGDQTLSICPVNHWGNEGPLIWNRTHLDPIRLPCAPIYALFPGPETLLVIHNVIVWCLVPAVFGLVRSESGSTRLALLATALVPLTPLLWPLAWNDYREMTLALPFIAWGIQGYRDRRPGLAALGIGGMLLCREEYGILVATLALLPPRAGEDVGTTYRWMARRSRWASAGSCSGSSAISTSWYRGMPLNNMWNTSAGRSRGWCRRPRWRWSCWPSGSGRGRCWRRWRLGSPCWRCRGCGVWRGAGGTSARWTP